jgi:hypothetical protein
MRPHELFSVSFPANAECYFLSIEKKFVSRLNRAPHLQ